MVFLVTIGMIDRAGAATEICKATLAEESPAHLEDVPDLDSTSMVFRDETRTLARRIGFSEAWIIDNLRQSRRVPYTANPDAPRPRYVVYLPITPAAEAFVRVAFLWDPQANQIAITKFSHYDQYRDRHEHQRVMRFAYIRRVEHKFSMADEAIKKMQRVGISLEDLDEGLANPVAEVVTNERHANSFWMVSDLADERSLSINYTELPGINYIHAVTTASSRTRASNITSSGLEHSNPEADRIKITGGPLRGRRVAFAPGIEQKISKAHLITRAEVIEAFALSKGDAPDDNPNRDRNYVAADQLPRRWFASTLSSGRIVKVVIIFEPDEIKIISAHIISAEKFEFYKFFIRRVGLSR